MAVPEVSLVVLIGVSGSGKSTFARKHFGPFEVISSDFCRGLVSGDGRAALLLEAPLAVPVPHEYSRWVIQSSRPPAGLGPPLPGDHSTVDRRVAGVRAIPGFDVEIRTVICSTNAIESVNARLRRAVRARGHLPTEQAALNASTWR